MKPLPENDKYIYLIIFYYGVQFLHPCHLLSFNQQTFIDK